MKLYNTLTGAAAEFVPAEGNKVKIYVCGVTPYSATHVGHALSYVAFDVLRRYLEYLGYQVRHVQNFTDVDDKIIQRAQEEGIHPDTLAERYIEDFFTTMDALNVQRAHIYPRATQEIAPIIQTINKLVENGVRLFRQWRCLLPGHSQRRVREAEPPHPGRYDGWRPDRSG